MQLRSSLPIFLSCCIFAVALLALSSCGADSSKNALVIYSPHGKEILEPIEYAFEKAHPTIDLIWYDLPTATCAARIRSEAAAPQADIWWGGPVGEFISAEQSGLLSSYTPSWIDQADAATYAASKQWFSDWQTPEVIMYNNKRLKKEEAPQDWDDLLDPKWTGKLIIRDPLQSGTMKTIYGAMILRAESVDAGFEWLKKLDKQNKGSYAAKPLMMYEQIKRGKGDITVWNMADAYIQSEQNGYPFGFIVPSSGTPVVLEGIAILNKAPHRQSAEVFFEWVTSAAQLIDQAHRFHRIPITRKDISKEQLPPWMAQDIKAIPIDWNSFATDASTWMERWKNDVRGSGAD